MPADPSNWCFSEWEGRLWDSFYKDLSVIPFIYRILTFRYSIRGTSVVNRMRSVKNEQKNDIKWYFIAKLKFEMIVSLDTLIIRYLLGRIKHSTLISSMIKISAKLFLFWKHEKEINYLRDRIFRNEGITLIALYARHAYQMKIIWANGGQRFLIESRQYRANFRKIRIALNEPPHSPSCPSN